MSRKSFPAAITGKLAFLLTLALPATPAAAGALTDFSSLPASMRQQVTGLYVKGSGTSTWYALEADPTTGALPVSGTFNDPSVGSTGAAVPSSATYLGISVGGTLTGATGTANGLKVDGSAVTQPISATSLPLPTGAATAAKQPALGTAGTPSADVLTVQGAASMTPLKVDGSAVTQPVSAASLPLPTGAATAANQATANTTLSTISGQLPTTLGAKTTANSLAVNIASDQTVPVSMATAVAPTGRSSSLVFRNNDATTNITTGAYVQVVASTGAAINRLYVFDSSGSALKIATGGAGSEVDKLYIPPGGSGVPYEINIPAGTRIAVEALDANATSGQLIITGLN